MHILVSLPRFQLHFFQKTNTKHFSCAHFQLSSMFSKISAQIFAIFVGWTTYFLLTNILELFILRTSFFFFNYIFWNVICKRYFEAHILVICYFQMFFYFLKWAILFLIELSSLINMSTFRSLIYLIYLGMHVV